MLSLTCMPPLLLERLQRPPLSRLSSATFQQGYITYSVYGCPLTFADGHRLYACLSKLSVAVRQLKPDQVR